MEKEHKTMIEFTDEQMEEILDYMKYGEFETIQEAIVHAVVCVDRV